MFLRCHTRQKTGKLHRYGSVVESRRVAGGAPVQRHLLYLGEINGCQEAAWRKTLTVFDEQRQCYEQLALFPADRPLPPEEANALAVALTALRLRRPRRFGDCWPGCTLWDELGPADFWDARLRSERGEVPWAKVLQLLAVNRLCEPGSEFAVHARWFERSAMDELLQTDFAVAAKDRLYRGLDRILPYKDELCRHLTARWKTLFDASFDVLLYDLTSTYFEGLCAEIPKARHGYSRDGRPGCREVGIALVVTTDLTPRAVLAALAGLQMVDVLIPTPDGRELVLPRYTEPAAEQAMLLGALHLTLPPQPPPRIRAGQIELSAAAPSGCHTSDAILSCRPPGSNRPLRPRQRGSIDRSAKVGLIVGCESAGRRGPRAKRSFRRSTEWPDTSERPQGTQTDPRP